jgi:hypothetical protein
MRKMREPLSGLRSRLQGNAVVFNEQPECGTPGKNYYRNLFGVVFFLQLLLTGELACAPGNNSIWTGRASGGTGRRAQLFFAGQVNINVFICGGFVNDCGISKSGRVMFLRPHRLFRTVATYNDNVKKGFVINSRIRVEPKGEMRTPSSSQSRKERSRNLEVSKGTNTRELNCSRINRVCVCMSSKGPTRRVPPVWLPPSLDLTFVGDIIGFNL